MPDWNGSSASGEVLALPFYHKTVSQADFIKIMQIASLFKKKQKADVCEIIVTASFVMTGKEYVRKLSPSYISNYFL